MQARYCPFIVAALTVVSSACSAQTVDPAEPALTGTAVSVGSAGGTFAWFDGGIKITIAPGTFSKDARIDVVRDTAVPLDPAAIRGAGYRVLGPAQFPAHGVSLMMHYDPGMGPRGVAQSLLRLHRLANAAWTAVPDAATDTLTQVTSAEITGPGTYGIKRVPPSTPCIGEEYRQFDFWLGEWNIPPGTSSITADAAGCAIFEEYRPGGMVGRSISVYDPTTGQWNQTYLFPGGAPPLIMSGSFMDGNMVMLAKRQGQLAQRWTWTRNDANTVTQMSESTNDNGQSWHVNFKGIYRRR